MTTRTGRSQRGPGWIFRLAPLFFLIGATDLAGCSCEDKQGDFALASDPKLLVTPESITFSAATPDRPEIRTVLISNVGSGAMTNFTYQLRKNEGPFTFVPPAIDRLNDGQSMELQITYRPDNDASDDDVLIIEASNSQRAEVILSTVPPRRELQCDPSTIIFSGSELGESATTEVEVVNIGTLPVTITGFAMEDGFEYAVVEAPELDLVLAPQESTSVTMSFTPFGGGMSVDALRILTSEAPGLFTCNVRSNTPLPQIAIDPPRVDFGSVPTGQSVDVDITVSNAGSAQLEIQPPAFLRGASPDIAFVDPPTEPVQIAPGDSVVLKARYTGGAEVANATAVLVNTDLTNPQAAIPMLGRPLRPDLVVSPESLAFGNVGQGATATRTLTLINNGTEDVIVSSMVVANPGEFTLEPDGRFPPTTGAGDGLIPAQGTVEVRVSYAPTNLGSDATTLSISSNDPDEPVIPVPLSANGLDRAECAVQIRPDPLNFGLIARGGVKILPANVLNTGTGPCTFARATAAGILNNAFTIEGTSINPNNTFGPGETLRVEVKYNPTAADINNGKLTVNITDPLDGNAQVFCNVGLRCQQNPNDFACAFMPPACGVDLTGFAGPSDIAVIPGSLDFGLVTLGCASQTTVVTVYNTGVADLSVSAIRLNGCSNEFELRGVPNLPLNIDRNTPVPIQVIYRPRDLGVDSCSLVITSTANPNEPDLLVPLRGEGTNSSHQIDVFEQLDGRKVDVLFVIDGSGSMSEEQDDVARNLDSFLSTAELFNNDYHIGVTHLDMDETKTYNGVRYEAGELMGEPAYVTRAHPSASQELRNRIRMGATGGSREAGLDAAYAAFSDPYITSTSTSCNNNGACSAPYNYCSPARTCGGRNATFLREDASLEIVILSDEEDQSVPTPSFFVDFFRSLKGFRNEALLNISTIIGADVGSNRPADCDTAEAGRRYGTVADATGGTIGSICSSNFSSFLQNIGNRAFGLRREFFLSRAAEPASVRVRVNGANQTTGWIFDETTNSVVFDRNAIPAAGADIEVEYDARCFR